MTEGQWTMDGIAGGTMGRGEVTVEGEVVVGEGSVMGGQGDLLETQWRHRRLLLPLPLLLRRRRGTPMTSGTSTRRRKWAKQLKGR